MKKKIIICCLMIILITVLPMISHKLVAGNQIKKETYLHLETIGYSSNSIENIKIKHSFINKLLGFNEWRIFVEFKSEPDIVFSFTYRDKQIVKQGITSKNAQLNIDEIHEYDQKFENGELKSK